jgi:hypothetical protein
MFAVRRSLGYVRPGRRREQTIGAADHQGAFFI